MYKYTKLDKGDERARARALLKIPICKLLPAAFYHILRRLVCMQTLSTLHHNLR